MRVRRGGKCFRGASGRHVGPGWPPGAPQIALGGGPGAARRPKKFMWRLLGASWGGKLIDFSFREGAPRSLPESLPESIFEASFLGAPPGAKKYEILCVVFLFLVVFLDAVALVFCLPRRSPARRRKLINRRNPFVFTV